MKKLTAILHKTDGTGQAGRWALPVTVWLSLLWLELLLILGGGRTLAAGTLLYVVLFSAAAAGVISLLVTATRSRRVNFVVLIVLLGIVTVFFGVEFYCRAFFKKSTRFSYSVFQSLAIPSAPLKRWVYYTLYREKCQYCNRPAG